MGNNIAKPNLTNVQKNTSSMLNSVIQQANKQTNCGPDCQREKKIEDLKGKYNTAKNNLENGPENLAEARKNYFTYAFGNKYFNDFSEKEFTEKSDKLVKTMKKQHTDDVNEINELLDNYKGLYISKQNTIDLLSKYKKENKDLESETDDNIKAVETNDRRVFYENQEISKLKKYNSFLSIIYWVTFALLIVIIIYNGYYSNFKLLGVVVLFFVFPRSFNLILNLLSKVGRFLYRRLPRNVYLNTKNM